MVKTDEKQVTTQTFDLSLLFLMQDSFFQCGIPTFTLISTSPTQNTYGSIQGASKQPAGASWKGYLQ